MSRHRLPINEAHQIRHIHSTCPSHFSVNSQPWRGGLLGADSCSSTKDNALNNDVTIGRHPTVSCSCDRRALWALQTCNGAMVVLSGRFFPHSRRPPRTVPDSSPVHPAMLRARKSTLQNADPCASMIPGKRPIPDVDSRIFYTRVSEGTTVGRGSFTLPIGFCRQRLRCAKQLRQVLIETDCLSMLTFVLSTADWPSWSPRKPRAPTHGLGESESGSRGGHAWWVVTCLTFSSNPSPA